MLSGNPNGHKVMYTVFGHIAGLTLPTPLTSYASPVKVSMR